MLLYGYPIMGIVTCGLFAGVAAAVDAVPRSMWPWCFLFWPLFLSILIGGVIGAKTQSHD
ncbi:hypothetical protein AB5I41_31250 [Sphingomonas sp. MMS24-JH45]